LSSSKSLQIPGGDNPVIIDLQQWTGAFHAPLLLQVFSVYINIVSNGSFVEGLSYHLMGCQPRAALALAATAMCHSLLDDAQFVLTPVSHLVEVCTYSLE